MARFSLALFIASIALAEISSTEGLEGEGGIRRMKSKDNVSFPTCDAAGSKSKKSKSKKDKKNKNKKNKSGSKAAEETCEETVECGQTYEGEVSLSSILVCNSLNADEAAITLSGTEAVLDCAGFGVYSGSKNPVKNTIGIKLTGGASAVNCLVNGFDFGYDLADGDNYVSYSTAFGNGKGVRTQGDGCMHLAEINAYTNDDEGICIESTGTVQMTSITANSNGGDAGIVVRVPRDGVLSIGAEDTTAVGNDNDGIQIDEETSNGKNAGNLTASFYGSTTLEVNGNDGFQNRNDLATVSFFDSVYAFGNSEEGLDARDGSSILTKKVEVTACANTIDVRNAGFVSQNTNITDNVCDTRQAASGTILCPGDCPTTGTATTC